jgi:hypothetical protein
MNDLLYMAFEHEIGVALMHVSYEKMGHPVERTERKNRHINTIYVDFISKGIK